MREPWPLQKLPDEAQSRIFINSGCSNRMTLRCCDFVARNLPSTSTSTNCALFIANCIGRVPVWKAFGGLIRNGASLRTTSTRLRDSSDGTKGLGFLLWLLHELKCS